MYGGYMVSVNYGNHVLSHKLSDQLNNHDTSKTINLGHSNIPYKVQQGT